MPLGARVSRVQVTVASAITVVAVVILIVDHVNGNGGGGSTGHVSTKVAVSQTVVSAAQPTTSTRFKPDPVVYVIAAGEGLFDVAKRNGLSTKELADFNGIVDPNAVFAGQRILIPPPSPTTSTRPAPARGPTTTLPVATTLPDDPPPTAAPVVLPPVILNFPTTTSPP